MKNRIFECAFCVVAFAVLLWFLLLNFGAAHMPDEIPQVSQWRNFFFRGIFAVFAVAMLLFVRPKVAIDVLLWCICTAATVEAVLGLMQLYGFRFSYHNMFRLTGSFYNPGPLGGYIAMALPVVLYLFIKTSQIYRRKILLIRPIIYLITIRYCVLLAMISVMLVVLPSTMSRTGWIAAVVSSVYVCWCSTDFFKKVLCRFNKRVFISLSIILLSICAVGVWKLKSESAFGRVFLWKISAMAVTDSPWVGNNNFSTAYANAQERYFQSQIHQHGINNLGHEEDVAAILDYAFNEYFNFAIEHGLPLFLIVVALIVVICVFGHRRLRYGLCGAVISFAVFAFASYPAHIPAFVAMLLLTLIGCVWVKKRQKMAFKIVFCLLAVVVSVAMFSRFNFYSQRVDFMRQWDKMRFMYTSKIYAKAADSYSKIYDGMRWNDRFLYEYGHSLFKIKKYVHAEYALCESAKISGDPMILNILGECAQARGNYQSAEDYYLRSVYRLPNRLYPHYLLYLLYSDPEWADTHKQQRLSEYQIITTKPLKTESSATDEMRRNVIELENTLNNNEL